MTVSDALQDLGTFRQLFASRDSQSTLPCCIRSVLRIYRTWCYLKEQKEVVKTSLRCVLLIQRYLMLSQA